MTARKEPKGLDDISLKGDDRMTYANGDYLVTDSKGKCAGGASDDVVSICELIKRAVTRHTIKPAELKMISSVMHIITPPPVEKGVDFLSGVLSSVDIEFSRDTPETEFFEKWLGLNLRDIIKSSGELGQVTVKIEPDKIVVDPTPYVTDHAGVTYRIDNSDKPKSDDTRVTLALKDALTVYEGDIYKVGLPLYIGGCVCFAEAHYLKSLTSQMKSTKSATSAISYMGRGNTSIALTAGLVEAVANQGTKSLISAEGNVIAVSGTREDIDIILPEPYTANYSDYNKMLTMGMLSGPVSAIVAGDNSNLNRDILRDATETAVFNCKSYFKRVSGFINTVAQKYLIINGVDGVDIKITLKTHPSEYTRAGHAINEIALSGILTTAELRRMTAALLSIELDDVAPSELEDPNRT